MSYNPGLVGIDNVQNSTISTNLVDNLVNFFDWGFLDKGGYINVSSPASGMYGGSKHIMKLVEEPNYSTGQVWQTFRENWVWETGISRSTQPIDISGIYRGSTFLPYSYNAGSGYYVGSGYRLNHDNGQVIFNSPIPATSVVSLNYSYKWLKVQKAEDFPFFQYIQQRSVRLDENFLTSSGNWAQLGQNRVQLPAIFIEGPVKTTFKPYQLGGGQNVISDIVVYAIGENGSICKNILDIISYQSDRTIQLYDLNGVYKSGDFPKNYRGDLVDKSKNYPQMLNDHYYGKCRIYDVQKSKSVEISKSLYLGTARFSTEIEMSNLP